MTVTSVYITSDFAECTYFVSKWQTLQFVQFVHAPLNICWVSITLFCSMSIQIGISSSTKVRMGLQICGLACVKKLNIISLLK